MGVVMLASTLELLSFRFGNTHSNSFNSPCGTGSARSGSLHAIIGRALSYDINAIGILDYTSNRRSSPNFVAVVLLWQVILFPNGSEWARFAVSTIRLKSIAMSNPEGMANYSSEFLASNLKWAQRTNQVFPQYIPEC
ncbi:hypothetical protein BDN67DRAFT_965944 [Paxillus ammoniavirescens]|nr:hypothetical protein BDN67DRAFT_965944 [Paxillus ammoniavirescens]